MSTSTNLLILSFGIGSFKFFFYFGSSSFIEAVTLYSGAFVLVDTNTSTGIHYIEMMTLYSGVFVLVDTNTNTGIQLASSLVAHCMSSSPRQEW